MALIDKETIRAEIERRINYYNSSRRTTNIFRPIVQELNSVLVFLDSLPEQPVEGLEEEVKKYWNAHNLDYRIGRVADLDFIFLCARHFAEWGAEHLKK